MSMKNRGGKKAGKPKGKLMKTGKTEKIAGYLAEEWAYKGGEKKASFWGSTELGAWSMMSAKGRGPQMDVPEEFKKGGFFPLRIVSEDGGMEAVSVEKKSMPDSLFEVPAGYKKMDMGGMMKGRPGY
jgi:hypothetical protein